MRKRAARGLAAAAVAAMVIGLPEAGPVDVRFAAPFAARAQEGHPLVGTWTGDWQPGGGARTHLTVVMSWDGKAVTGLVNPGPEAMSLSRVTVDWATWTLRIEGERKTGGGAPVRIAAEGRLEEIGSPRRRIVGTWTEGDVSGALRLMRE